MKRFERLSSEHDTADFHCENEDLDAWLHDAALTADRAGTARVYLWLDAADRVSGYFAIVPHTVRRGDVPSKVGRGAPAVIPGFLLARLALSESLQGEGHGGELLAHALAMTLEAIRAGGGRVIVVDAIDDNARKFYDHFGFQAVPEVPERLYMKASTAARSVGVDWP